MSRRPQILAGCLRLLACGPETTRDLSLHVGAPRALVAVALHGEPGVTRDGDVWTLTPEQTQREVEKRERAADPQNGGGRPECSTIVYLRNHPGWHSYASLAEACKVTYSAVALGIKRHQSSLKFNHDASRRVLVAWKGDAVVA